MQTDKRLSKEKKRKIITQVIAVIGVVSGIVGILSYVGFNPFDPHRATVTPTISPTILVFPSLTSVPVGIVSIDIISPIKAGEIAVVTVHTAPGAICHLDYYTPTGNQSDADGLGQVVANSFGECSWRWRIAAATAAGSGQLVVSVNDITRPYSIEIEK